MNKEYYTPEIEDLFIGYECEIKVPIRIKEEWKFSEFISGKITSIFPNFEWTDFQDTSHSFSNTFKLEIKTPYLTKEQIENEGWKSEIHWNDHWQFSKNDKKYWLFYYFDTNLLSIINREKDCAQYGGECKSINEFRKICKLLKIE